MSSELRGHGYENDQPAETGAGRDYTFVPEYAGRNVGMTRAQARAELRAAPSADRAGADAADSGGDSAGTGGDDGSQEHANTRAPGGLGDGRQADDVGTPRISEGPGMDTTQLEAVGGSRSEGTATPNKKLVGQEVELDEGDRENAALRAEVASLKFELGDLKAANVERDWKDKVRDEKIAEQERQLADLKAALGGSRLEHTDRPDPAQPASAIADREVEAVSRSKRRGWHLPSDTTNNLLSAGGGMAVGVGAGYISHVAADYGSIGVSALALGVAGLASWREHRKKAKDGASDRPEG